MKNIKHFVCLLTALLLCSVVMSSSVMAETRTFVAKIERTQWEDSPLNVDDYVIGKVEWEEGIQCPGCIEIVDFSFVMNNGETVDLESFSSFDSEPPELNYSFMEDGVWRFQAVVSGEAEFEGYGPAYFHMSLQQYDFDGDGFNEINFVATFGKNGSVRGKVVMGDILGDYELPVSSLDMNAGFNDAWYEPATSGQGYQATVFSDTQRVALFWYTYDTYLPDENATSNLGDPGHRWLTSIGKFEGNRGVLGISLTGGGVFDTPNDIFPVDRKDGGYFTLIFDDCYRGTVEYFIHSKEEPYVLTGTVPIQRIAYDNVPLCEALSNPE